MESRSARITQVTTKADFTFDISYKSRSYIAHCTMLKEIKKLICMTSILWSAKLYDEVNEDRNVKRDFNSLVSGMFRLTFDLLPGFDTLLYPAGKTEWQVQS